MQSLCLRQRNEGGRKRGREKDRWGMGHLTFLWKHLLKMSCKNSFPTFPPAAFTVNIMDYGFEQMSQQ